MSVHVSLHLVSAAPAENTKPVEPSDPGMSFSRALSAATDVDQQTTMQSASGRDAEKKQPRKADSSKDSLSTWPADVPQTTAYPVTSTPVVPTVPKPDRLPDQPVDETGIDESASGSAIQQIGLRPVRGANPILSTAQGDSGVASPSMGSDDESATPVSDGNDATSGAILGASDEAYALAPGSESHLSGPADEAPQAASDNPAVRQDDSIQKDQPNVSSGDATQVAAPMSLPIVPVPPPQPAAVEVLSERDLAALTTSASSPVAGSEIKEGSSRPTGAASKDRPSSDVHGKHKADDTGDDSQGNGVALASPLKFSVTPTGSSHQQNENQTGAKDNLTAQTAQGTVTPPTSDFQVAAPASASAHTSDASSQPSASNNLPAADALASPTLSGARLIQSIHQSEMKLGMNSAEFGNISISTSVTHQTLSAQISLDHSELGRALAAQLPAMEEKLGNAYGLQARVEVRDAANAAYSGSSQHSSQGRHGGQSESARSTISASGLGSPAARSTSTPVVESARLDVRI